MLDELHTYRGRQGADVALLVRRLRERCGNPRLQCIGTSATMASGDSRVERNAAVADVASKLFGVTVDQAHVIDESLRWSVLQPRAPSSEALRVALTTPLPEALDWPSFTGNPLAAWIEATFGLREDADRRLRRRDPITLGRYLRARQTWPSLTTNLAPDEYAALLAALVEALRKAGYLVQVDAEAGAAVQLCADALL